MNCTVRFVTVLLCLLVPTAALNADPVVSDATQECLECHGYTHPGIVADWQSSRHARTTPKEGGSVEGNARRMSATAVPSELQPVVVGCAECHGLRPDQHADTFEHNGYDIHTVASPADCATCHDQEVEQYGHNIMSEAFGNLSANDTYRQLQNAVLAPLSWSDGQLSASAANDHTRAEACYYCHGTRMTLAGSETRDTDFGEMEFPRIVGWPNQGVGRINLDGSKGACTPCHTRHAFAIQTARKPYTCKECHLGPDVPAYKVYAASKHGNIHDSMQADWNFEAVPWTVGQDFTAPTCATCHMSLLVNPDDEVLAPRTHQMGDRLAWRILGLIYAHPHPREADTTTIRNRHGQSLPTDFEGGRADAYLIDAQEMNRRTANMQRVCSACHAGSWVDGHWQRLENTIQTTNASTRTATAIMESIWSEGHARGLESGQNPFDEAVERLWVDSWLFYANTIRFSTAMAGGGDYGVFTDGRYQFNGRIRELSEWLALRRRLQATRPGLHDAED